MANIEFPVLITFLGGFMAFALGLIWYNPRVLGNKWVAVRGQANSEANPTHFLFVVTFLLWMLASTFYTFLSDFYVVDDVAGYLCLSSLLWVAFAMPPTIMGALYTGYPFQAVAIDSAYQLGGYYLLALAHVVGKYFPILMQY